MFFCFNADDLSVNLTSDNFFFKQVQWVAATEMLVKCAALFLKRRKKLFRKHIFFR